MTTGDGRTITYTAFDKPIRITKGATTVYAAGKAYEWICDASGTKMKHYIGDFAVITKTAAGSGETVNYLHRDHLGSVDTITDHTGAVIQRMSFDAWGKRREINWQSIAEGAITAFNTDTTTRGFTGHEMIDSVGLIHMNGRVYDPTLGRFLSADPNVQALDNLQNFNRYSYVLNNPLSYTDPTGFFFSKLFKAIGRALKKLLRSPIVRAIIHIVACASFPGAGCAIASGAMAAAGGGSMADVFKAVAFSFIAPAVWGGAKSAIADLGIIGKALVHGIVNGALTVAQGGNFLVGFATGAIGKLTSFVSNIVSQGNMLVDTLIVAASGCASSVIAGGKCANGAITAAFANMYNKWSKEMSKGFADIDNSRDIGKTKVYIGYRKIGSLPLFGDYYHSFIKVVSPSGEEWYLSAFNAQHFDVDMPFKDGGFMIFLQGKKAMDQEYRDYPNIIPSYNHVYSTSESFTYVKLLLRNFAKKVFLSNVTYRAEGPNSNSAAHEAVTALGISRPHPPQGFWAQGWDKKLNIIDTYGN